VENLGIIFIGLGLSLLFLGRGHTLLGVLALIAALYHSLNHALFKGLLFLGAGAILHGTHERDLEQMGGLLRRMPWTGLFFLIGGLSLAGLPPFNGFVSEWLIFQSALQSWVIDNGVLRALIPIAMAVLALTTALVAATVVKTYGVAFLGQARSRHVRRAHAAPWGMRLAQGLLAALCILLGVVPTWVMGLIESVPKQVLGTGLGDTATPHWLWLAPIAPENAIYSAPLALLSLLVLGGLVSLVLRRGAVRRVRPCDAWDCGFAPPTPRMQYTATAFAQPLRRVFAMLMQVEATHAPREDGTPRYQLKIGDRLWSALYLPVSAIVESAARRIVRLQSGHVRGYLGWTLVTLIVLLWIVGSG
jgi:NADH:ubiquinone oxidoreductase subunit 5 (subunit L)/multisubunit Na+/H+ antiporter MnhA subunit